MKNCPKCGLENTNDSNFCVKCGSGLKEGTATEKVVKKEATPKKTKKEKGNILGYLMILVDFLLKPIKTFEKNQSKLNNTKTSLIYAGIVSGIMMILTLLKAMLGSLFTKSMDYSTFKMKTSFDLGNLKNLDWLSLTLKNLLIYAGIIFAVAAIYYLACLVFKKTISFIKLLYISASSIIPYIVLGMIVSPIIGKIWAPLGIIATVIGVVYSLLILMNLLNSNITFEEEDKKIYFNLICLSILGVAGYYLYINLFMSGLSSQVSDVLDMFK